MTRKYLSRTLLAGLIVLLAVTGSSTFSNTSGDIPQQDPSQVDIDPNIESKFQSNIFTAQSKDRTEVLVSLESYPQNVSTVEEMDKHASESQKPLKKLADKNPEVTVKNKFWITNAVLLEINQDFPLENIAGVKGVTRLNENSEFALQESDTFSETSNVNTQSSENTYGLNQINATETWEEFDTRGENIRISVIDTGIDIDHDDLELYTDDEDDPTYPGGWAEFKSGEVEDSEPRYCDYDGGDHGTHVSGTIAGGNESGTNIGVAPNTELMNVGALMINSTETGECVGELQDILDAMEWSVDNDADIISKSLGADGYEESYIDAIQNAETAGTVVIAASGNSGEDTSISPGNIFDAISVGATNEDKDVTEFSGGEEIDTDEIWGDDAPDDWSEQYVVPSLVAPGSNVESALPGNNYGLKSGTSMATPHVSGAAGLIQSATETALEPDQLNEALEETAWKPEDSCDDEEIDGRDIRCGQGILDTYEATYYSITRFDEGFEVRDVSLNVSEINITEEFNVEGSVENFEDETQTIDLEFKLNDTLNSTEEVEVDAGTEKQFSFETVIEEEGFYKASLNRAEAGSIEAVMPPPEFIIDEEELELNESEISQGDKVNTSGALTNEGGDGVADLRLFANETEKQGKELELGFEEEKPFSFTQQFEDPGFYEVSVNDTFVGNLDVLEAARLSVNNIELVNKSEELNESQILEGEYIESEIEAENIGEEDGEFDINLSVNGEKVQNKSTAIESGETELITFTEQFDSRGEYNISSEDKFEILEVLREGNANLENTSLSEQSIVEGETAELTASTNNTGDLNKEDLLNFSVDGEKIEKRNVVVGNRSTKETVFEQSFDEPRTYNLSVNGTENTLEVLKQAELVQEDFKVVNQSVEGNEIEFSSLIENIGEVEGEFNVNLKVTDSTEDKVLDTEKDIILDAEENETVVFTETIYEPENYTANSLNKSKHFEVLEGPNLEIKDGSVNETEIFVDETLEVTASIENTGSIEGTDLFEFSAEEIFESKSLELEPDEKKDVSKTTSFSEEGEYTVNVNNTEIDTVTVEEPDTEINQVSEAVSDKGVIDVEIELNNPNRVSSTKELELEINDSIVDEDSFKVEPESSKNISLQHNINETGLKELYLNSEKLTEFSLDPDIAFSDLSPDNQVFEEEEPVSFSATVDVIGEGELVLELDGSEEITADLEPGRNDFGHTDIFSEGIYDWSLVGDIEGESFSSEIKGFDVEAVEEEEGGGAPVEEDEEESEEETVLEEDNDSISVTGINEGQKIRFNQTDLPIESIEFESAENDSIEIESTNVDTSSPMEEFFEAETTLTEELTLEFSITNDWLEENNFEPEEASLYRQGGEEWSDLGAELVEEEDTVSVYSVTVDGFSVFATGIDQTCYSEQSVDAADENTCSTFDNVCEVPDEKEEVNSCGEWEAEQETRERIRDIETESDKAGEKLVEAEEKLEEGNLQEASELADEAEEAAETPGYTDLIRNIFLGILALSVLAILTYYIKSYRDKQSIVDELLELEKQTEKKYNNGYEVSDCIELLEEADKAVNNQDYEKASELSETVRDRLERME